MDVDAWRAANLVRLHPGMVNRWLIARELDSNPTEKAINGQLIAFFAKCFEREISDYVNEVLGFNNVGPADNIQIKTASRAPIAFPSVQRREQLPKGPLPLVKAHSVLYMDVTFNYRGKMEWISWPAVKVGLISTISPSGYEYCPVDCDAILLAAGEPVSLAPPKVTAGSVVHQTVSSAASSAWNATVVYAVGTVVAAGTLLYLLKKVL